MSADDSFDICGGCGHLRTMHRPDCQDDDEDGDGAIPPTPCDCPAFEAAS